MTAKTIFLINSDLGKNRGDRSIAEGVIALIRSRNPGARIIAVSEFAERDEKWFDAEFLRSDVTTLNPLKWCSMARVAAKSDCVYWGGGELLKDYTNSIGLWYWIVFVLWIRIFNRNLFGICQGIGQTNGKLNRWLITFVVRRTKKFSLRDAESYEKLIQWGVPPEKLVVAADPAVLCHPQQKNGESPEPQHDLDEEFLKDFVVIAPRNWFHYQKSGLLPFRYRQKWLGAQPNEQNERYIDSVRHVVSTVTARFSNVLLVPMHMGEDVRFCEQLLQSQADLNQVRVLSQDTVSPKALRELFARARFVVGFRLHATIIATSVGTPALTFYYVDKGRLYFEQLRQQENSFPIETLLEKDFATRFETILESFAGREDAVRQDLVTAVERVREAVKSGYKELHG